MMKPSTIKACVAALIGVSINLISFWLSGYDFDGRSAEAALCFIFSFLVGGLFFTFTKIITMDKEGGETDRGRYPPPM